MLHRIPPVATRPCPRSVSSAATHSPRALSAIRDGLAALTALTALAMLAIFSLLPVATRAAEPSPAAKSARMSSTHVPDVEKPAPTDAPGYRAQLLASVQRYKDHYAAAALPAAMSEARVGLALAEAAGNRRDQSQFSKAAGYVAWLLGDTSSALDHEQRVLAFAEESNDDHLRSIAHRMLGAVYGQMRNEAKRREHTEAALRFAERTGDGALRYAAINNLANVALVAGDFATARRLHEETLAFRRKSGHLWDATGSLTNLADVADAERDYPRALALHEEALALRAEYDDQRGQVRSLRQTAAILRKLGRTDEALARLRDALARAEKITGHELLGDIWQEFAATHEARGEFAAALATERRAHAEREIVDGDLARTRIAELEARFELGRKQATIERLEREQRVQQAERHARETDLARIHVQRYALLALVVLATVALAALYSRHRVKLAAERRVLEQMRAARDAATEADRIKTRFLGIASHDIRTPLDNIVALVADVRADGLVPPEAAERLDWIAAEAQRVAGLAQDLLNATALEVGRLELRRTHLDLAPIVHAAVDEHRRFAIAKRIPLTLTAPPIGEAMLHADGPRLRQVAANLVSNAVKFTPPGKSVHVTLRREAAAITFAVRDEGPGLGPDELARLFTPYARLAAAPTAGESSHGLGLSIAHEIVQLHGGRITVESLPGEGATFVVTLPIAPPPAA
ncbi:MAG: hypothetical protein RLZZ15_1997 [Verrucomicrobiota bacterium]